LAPNKIRKICDQASTLIARHMDPEKTAEMLLEFEELRKSESAN
jgi:hypothetical protein